ncbi:MAG: ELWxxDGT repeat protein, partial [Thermoanaerobaculia bacterium]
FGTVEAAPDAQAVDGSLWSTAGTPGDARLLGAGVGVTHGGRLLGRRVLFFAVREERGEWVLRLWRSEGTAAGTEVVAEIERLPAWFPHGGHGSPPEIHDIAIAGDRLHFLSLGALWRSDGTTAGTTRVEDPCGGACDTIRELAAVGDTLYFAAREETSNGIRETLWRSDGSPEGSHALAVLLDVTFEDWSARSGAPGIARLTPAGSRLFFLGDDGRHGAELWVSDGTEAGTRMVRDLRPGPAGSHPTWLTAHGDGVFFAADGGLRGQELWSSDGSGRGTRLVRDIAPGAVSSYPQELAVVGGRLVFAAFHPTHGLEAWQSDGTAAGTRLLADVLPGPGSSAPRSFTLAGGTLFFVSGRPRLGYELWAIGGAGE